MTVITRFPPSPTGFMHIGNARTALFNYLYARHTGGQFVLRIEDTDRARHSEEAVQVILNGLNWLGLEYDNEPVSQFANKQRHIDIAKELLDKGQAYYCYCTAEELEEMRAQAKAEGRPVAYDRRWRDRDPSEAPDDIPPVIRIKAPLEGKIVVEDKVQGRVEVDARQIDDFIILRSDETPTYMLAVVVDDYDMNITHVIRGDDHLNNTFRQNVIYDAMDWEKPIYAHLPLIHGPDGGKFSKRHGAQSVEEYRDMGYLPEALCNYLLRLGWAHGDDEIISREQAIEWFDLDAINKAAAKFDFDKLQSLNAHYIKEADNERLLTLVLDTLDDNIDEIGKTRLLNGMDGLKDRAKTIHQIAEDGAFYYQTTPIQIDEKAQKHLDNDGLKTLSKLLEKFKNLDSFSSEKIEQTCRDLAGEMHGGKLGKVMMPLRSALTGMPASPPLFEVANILGQEETCARIEAVL